MDNTPFHTCPKCGCIMPIEVRWSAAGNYVGTFHPLNKCENFGPYTRESGYFATTHEANEYLNSLRGKASTIDVRFAFENGEEVVTLRHDQAVTIASLMKHTKPRADRDTGVAANVTPHPSQEIQVWAMRNETIRVLLINTDRENEDWWGYLNGVDQTSLMYFAEHRELP